MNSETIPKPGWFEWLTVAAIFAGPIFALFAQRVLDSIREKRERRVKLYLTLMSTRATPLAPDHINALNSIDVVFSGKRDQQVREAWHHVLSHIVTDSNQQSWNEKYSDLKVDLFREIGNRVGYSFSTDYLKRQFYYPIYYGDMEKDQLQIRKALTSILGADGLRINVVGVNLPTQHNVETIDSEAKRS